MDKKIMEYFMTQMTQEEFEKMNEGKIIGEYEFNHIRTVYKPKHYPGPIAMDAIPSEEMKEYHRKSGVQINIPKDFNL